MSGEMIERVARALAAQDNPDLNPDTLAVRGTPQNWARGFLPDAPSAPLWQFYVGDARAAMEAMREPTPAMLKAFYGDVPVDRQLGDDWRDMIDEALK